MKVAIGSVFVVIMLLTTFKSGYQMLRGKFRPGDLCIFIDACEKRAKKP